MNKFTVILILIIIIAACSIMMSDANLNAELVLPQIIKDSSYLDVMTQITN